MPLTLAFTSCMDTLNYPDQPGWQALARAAPDVIVLLGDSIYMDYGWGEPHADEPNGSPKHLPLQHFSHRMHTRYRAQYAVPTFRHAIQGRAVHAIWDDHDFAWNNSRGAGPAGAAQVSPGQRRIATAHFRAWQQALAAQPAAYPADTVNPAAPPADDAGIGRSIALPGQHTWLHLMDARSHRDGDEDDSDHTLYGHDQRHAVEESFHNHPDDVHIVATPEPMEKWRDAVDAQWLVGWATRRKILTLCGDVHEPQYVGWKANGKKDWGKKDKTVLHEFTASAMAQGPTGFFGKKRNVFGVLEIGDATINVRLQHGEEVLDGYTLDRASWQIN